MQETFLIPYHITLIEFYKVSLYAGLRNNILRRFFIFIPGVLLALGILTVIAFPPKEWYSWIIQLIVFPLFPVLFFLVGIFLISFITMQLKPAYFKGITYEFTHWGMFKKGKTFEYSRQWSGFVKIKETKSFLLLYADVNNMHVLQKRMFKSVEEVNDFKRFAEESLVFSA